MRLNRSVFFFVLSLGVITWALCSPAAAQEPEKVFEGVNRGNYNIKQSFEFGGRITDFTGNQAVYRTFVNFNDGPRLLEHTLQMRSLNHQGWLFDDFFLSSFGYGGDPNNVSRLRAYKNKWYNFGATFRLDRNLWDFNLLANPLNPTTSNPFVPITFSLHKMELVRRLSDYNLTLFPQSRMRVRLGYARNISEGPSFTSFHEGTDVLTFQPWKTTLNSYSVGVDFKMLPKTNISYDQFFHRYKGDTTWTDTVGLTQLGVPRFFAQLSTGQPVDLGIIFNTTANQPCAMPISDSTTSPPTASPTCNGYLVYDRTGNVRTSYPTEQLSFQSSYFANVDLSGRVAYSSSDNDVFGYNESYDGLVTRTRQRQFLLSGPSNSKRVSATADFGITWQPADKLRVVDTFHFTHFRLPGFFDLTESSLFGTSMLVAPNTFTPGPAPPPSCPTPTSPGCPQHNSSSPADIIREQFSVFLGQNSKYNQSDILYDFTRRFSGRIGYRFANREITEGEVEASDLLFFPTLPERGACAFLPAPAPPGTLPSYCTRLPDGSVRGTPSAQDSERVTINEHSLLWGLSARLVETLRLSFDMEWFYADRAFTRISPRHLQRYKLRGSYQPAHWVSLSASVNILEKRNNVTEVFHKQHSRTYGFSVALEPNDRFGLDFGYDLNDVFSQTNICFVGTLRPPGTSPCPTSLVQVQQISLYDHDTHFGYFNLMWRPLKRLKTLLGYALTSTSGETLILTPNAPPGPLRFNYHKPYAGIEVDLTGGFFGRANWGYYGYNEKALPDPTTSPRDFRGNLVQLSIRYAF